MALRSARSSYVRCLQSLGHTSPKVALKMIRLYCFRRSTLLTRRPRLLGRALTATVAPPRARFLAACLR